MSFERALKLLLRYEGGYSNNPHDAGGPTYAGVSQRAVANLRDENGKLIFDFDSDGEVDEIDIQSLKKFPDKLEWFYRTRYWDLARCDEFGWPIALPVFDAAVHSGVKQSIVLLQRALGVAADGIVGPGTLQAFHREVSRTGTMGVVRLALWERASLFAGICQKRPSQRTFLAGWLWRLVEVEKECRA